MAIPASCDGLEHDFKESSEINENNKEPISELRNSKTLELDLNDDSQASFEGEEEKGLESEKPNEKSELRNRKQSSQTNRESGSNLESQKESLLEKSKSEEELLERNPNLKPILEIRNGNPPSPNRIKLAIPTEDLLLHLKVMSVGGSGLGKTTFCKALFGVPDDDNKAVAIEPMTTEIKIVHESEIPLGTNNNATLHVKVVDTPGYNSVDLDADIRIIESYQLSKMENFFQDPEIDERIDICFYFIAAHRLKESDIIFMKRIAPIVNIVPLVAKSDCMTVTERDAFLKLVNEKLEKENIPVYELCPKKKVFAIISATNETQSRDYPWGIASVNNENHSDIGLIRNLLLEKKFFQSKNEMNKKTRQFTKQWSLFRYFQLWDKAHHTRVQQFLKVLLFILFLVCFLASLTWTANHFAEEAGNRMRNEMLVEVEKQLKESQIRIQLKEKQTMDMLKKLEMEGVEDITSKANESALLKIQQLQNSLLEKESESKLNKEMFVNQTRLLNETEMSFSVYQLRTHIIVCILVFAFVFLLFKCMTRRRY